MLCVKNHNTDPYFNAATEEHLFKNFRDDCFMLYRNVPGIFIGKHQNALAEINMDYVRSGNIPVVRRLSGGGTVYHDLGNLNFTFIKTGEPGKLVDFKGFTEPIVEVLHKLNVPARFESLNDLKVGEKKISGNAEHVIKNRVMHHGTLLFSSDLFNLKRALETQPDVYRGKAVKSKRSIVANISEFLNEELSIFEFRDIIQQHIMDSIDRAKDYELSEHDNHCIQDLVKEKYSRWEWNFGYSPPYQFHKEIRLGKEKIVVDLSVEKGIITRTRIESDNRAIKKGKIEKLLTGLPHKEEELKENLLQSDLTLFPSDIDLEEFVKELF